jgi:transposase-like protein
VDETFIGGKARNMHLDKRERRITGTGGKDKTIVFGALQRGGKVRTMVVADRKRSALHTCVKEHVEAGAVLYSDALASYDGLAQEYAHKVIDHAVKYVDGKIHTNGLDNFWSLLKRGIGGTYVSVDHSICFVTLMSKCSATTIAAAKSVQLPISTALTVPYRRSQTSALPIRKSPARMVRRLSKPWRGKRGPKRKP